MLCVMTSVVILSAVTVSVDILCVILKSVFILTAVIVSVDMLCHYAKCHHTECCYSEFRYAMCHNAECYSTEGRYRYTMCMLRVVILNAIKLRVDMLCVITLSTTG
jgi:hypothetical protein